MKNISITANSVNIEYGGYQRIELSIDLESYSDVLDQIPEDEIYSYLGEDNMFDYINNNGYFDLAKVKESIIIEYLETCGYKVVEE